MEASGQGMAAQSISDRLPPISHRLPPTQAEGFLAEQGPGFIPPDLHRDDLGRKRDDAMQAAEFHRRKLSEAEAVIVSVDSALGALKEQLGADSPPTRSY